MSALAAGSEASAPAGAAPPASGERLRDHLGLQVDPFAPAALPDFYFVGGQRRFLVQQAVHQLYFGAPIVLLVGAWGAGKSRLLTEVRAELAGLADLCLTAATVMTDAATLRHEVAQAAGLPAGAAHSNENLLASLERSRPAAGQPQPVLLLLDDAHLLAPVDLAEVCDLVRRADGRIRALLAAEVSLFASWPSQIGGADGLVARFDLEPLDLYESADYLRTRLQAAGLRRPLPLDSAAERQLFKESRGNLAAIHEVGARLLLGRLEPSVAGAVAGGGLWRQLSGGVAATEGAAADAVLDANAAAASIAPRRPLRRLAGAAIAIVAVGAIVLWRSGGESEQALTSDAVAVGADATGTTATRRRVPLVLDWEAPSATAGDTQGSTVGQADGTYAGSGVADPAVPPDAVQLAQPRTAAAATAGAAPAPVVAEPGLPVAAAPPPAQPNRHAAGQDARASSTASAPAARAPAPAPAPARPAGPTAADEQALLALAPSQQYMVQLMGARSLADLRRSIERSGLTGRVYYVAKDVGGKQWFSALVGPYSQAGARQAVARLPASLQAAKPWPRPLAAVQGELRN